jgi:hypothetical protein
VSCEQSRNRFTSPFPFGLRYGPPSGTAEAASPELTAQRSKRGWNTYPENNLRSSDMRQTTCLLSNGYITPPTSIIRRLSGHGIWTTQTTRNSSITIKTAPSGWSNRMQSPLEYRLSPHRPSNRQVIVQTQHRRKSVDELPQRHPYHEQGEEN